MNIAKNKKAPKEKKAVNPKAPKEEKALSPEEQKDFDQIAAFNNELNKYITTRYKSQRDFCIKAGLPPSSIASTFAKPSRYGTNAMVFLKMKELDPNLDLNALFSRSFRYSESKDLPVYDDSKMPYSSASRLERRIEDILITINTKIKEIDPNK